MDPEHQRIVKYLADLVGRPLDTIMHTTKWSTLPAQDRVMADVLARDVQRFTRHVVEELEELRQKFVALETRLRRAEALTNEEGDESLWARAPGSHPGARRKGHLTNVEAYHEL